MVQDRAMNKGASFTDVWRGWSIAMTVLSAPVVLLYIVLVPEQRAEVWPVIFLVPIIAMGQGVMIGAVVVLGNKLWSLIR